MVVGVEKTKPDEAVNQPFLFGLPEVRPDGSENLNQRGKLMRKKGPAKTTPEERRLMHANQGNTGVASSEDWERRRDINND